MYRSRGYQTKVVNEARLSSRRSSAADRQSVKRDYCMRGLKVLPPHGAWVTEANETRVGRCGNNRILRTLIGPLTQFSIDRIHIAARPL